MKKWWRKPESEAELLERLYDMTNGYFMAADDVNPANSGSVPWGGYEEAQERSEGANYLRRYFWDVTVRIGKFGLLPLPAVSALAAPFKLKFGYGAMAGAAWACGFTKGVGPKSREEASYDLLAITVLWAQKQQPQRVVDMVAKASFNIALRKPFGKELLYAMASNGLLKFGRRTLGEPIGTLTAITFSEEVLPALGGELFSLFHDELFAGFVDEFVPGVASFTATNRAWKRVKVFHELADTYYEAKAKRR